MPKDWVEDCFPDQGGAGKKAVPAWREQTFTAEQLQGMTFPPVSWVVPGMIPGEGLTLLCSKPKFGKSWLAYDLCISCTTGRFTLGEIRPAQGDVLYLALEDSRRRLQRRMTKLLPTFNAKWPEKLTITTEWRRLHEGGLDDIREWHAQTKEAGRRPIMVVIDVLAKVRKPAGNKHLYDADYEAIGVLAHLAHELGVAIVAIHHTRKMAADDLMEMVSGSFGTTGAADTVLILANKAGGVVLDIRGRDVESAEKAVEFDKDTCRWRILGDSAEIHVSEQRSKIIAALKEVGEPMTITALVEATWMKRNPLEALLGKMVRDQTIRRIRTGLYAHKDYVAPPADRPTRARSDRSDRSDSASQSTAQTTKAPENKGDSDAILPSDRSDRESTDGLSGNGRDTTEDKSSENIRSDRSDDQIGIQVIDGIPVSEPSDLIGCRSDRSDRSDEPPRTQGPIVVNGRGARVTLRIVPRSPPAAHRQDDAHRCAQCGGEPDGKELLHHVQGSPTWLHRECARFFKPPPEAA